METRDVGHKAAVNDWGHISYFCKHLFYHCYVHLCGLDFHMQGKNEDSGLLKVPKDE